MATRLWFQASGTIASPTNPTFDANWEQNGQATRLPLTIKAQAVAQTALTNSAAITVPITTTQQILCDQFVSDAIFDPIRLDASVTLSFVMRVGENATTNNAFLAYMLRAVSADGARALATLASSMTNAGTEYALTSAPDTRLFSAIALTATTLSEPWRLVMEIGAHAQAPTVAGSVIHRRGCNAASDFALTSALTTDLNPWMELSVNLNALSTPTHYSIKSSGLSVAGGIVR